MADLTTGELQAVAIGDLPLAPDIYDDTLIPVEQGGEAKQMTGAQWKAYGVAAAKEEADRAAEAATRQPIIQNGTWWTWDAEQEKYVDTGTTAAGEKGPAGAVFTPNVDEEGNLSWSNNGSLENPETVNIKGDKGKPFTYDDFTEEQIEALRGPSGVSPEISVTDIDGGKRITIVAANGTSVFDLMDGEDGYTPQKNVDYFDGEDGATVVSLERTSGTGAAGTTDTYTITMSDGQAFTFQVYNGADGKGSGDMLKSIYDQQNKNTDVFDYVDKAIANIDVDVTADEVTFEDGETFQEKYDSGELKGQDGSDGVSPAVSVESITGGHRITITDANSTKTVDVMDGSPGTDGDDGVGVASVEQTTTSAADGGENVITVTLTNSTKYTFTVKNGSKGSDGAAGAAGKDGSDGAPGAAATINGVNALTLAAEEPLALEQSGGTATLKLTGDVGVTANEATATLTTSGWTTHSALGYQQTVTVTGITAAAQSISTDVELSTTDKDSNTAILAAYALIAANPATPGANKVTFYAESIPEVNVPVVVGWL